MTDNEALSRLQQIIAECLSQHQIAPDDVLKITVAMTEQIREEFSGLRVYIPKHHYTKAEQLRQQIIAEYNGSNVKTLARRYRLSVQWVYRILQQHRKRQL